MRYFIHVIVDGALIADHEGEEFADPAEARASALRSGRELVADWLLQDQHIPSQSFIQLANADGRIVETFPLDGIALGTILGDPDGV